MQLTLDSILLYVSNYEMKYTIQMRHCFFSDHSDFTRSLSLIPRPREVPWE